MNTYWRSVFQRLATPAVIGAVLAVLATGGVVFSPEVRAVIQALIFALIGA